MIYIQFLFFLKKKFNFYHPNLKCYNSILNINLNHKKTFIYFNANRKKHVEIYQCKWCVRWSDIVLHKLLVLKLNQHVLGCMVFLFQLPTRTVLWQSLKIDPLWCPVKLIISNKFYPNKTISGDAEDNNKHTRNTKY